MSRGGRIRLNAFSHSVVQSNIRAESSTSSYEKDRVYCEGVSGTKWDIATTPLSGPNKGRRGMKSKRRGTSEEQSKTNIHPGSFDSSSIVLGRGSGSSVSILGLA